MPELPEVETTCLSLRPVCVNHKIKQVEIRHPMLRWPVDPEIKQHMTGRTVQSIHRRGKYLIFSFTSGQLIIHLGMSGHFKIVPNQAPWVKHDHFGFLVGDQWCRLNDPRRFGAILWTRDYTQHPLIQSLGVEPLEPAFKPKWLYDICQTRQCAIKSTLMNAKLIVGVGNIYASESLFQAGIHPKLPSHLLSLEDCQKLVKAIKHILKAAIRQGGTTLNDFRYGQGKLGYFQQKLAVYGRADQPCIECGHPIEKCVINQRATYYCLNCQALPMA